MLMLWFVGVRVVVLIGCCQVLQKIVVLSAAADDDFVGLLLLVQDHACMCTYVTYRSMCRNLERCSCV